MGSITRFNNNPATWPQLDTITLKPEYGGEKAIKVIFGSIDYDDYGDETDNYMYVRESILEGILNEKYTVRVSTDKATFDTLDENGEVIPRLTDFVY